MRRLHPDPAADVDALEAYADLPVAVGRPAVRLDMVASIDGATAIEGVSGGLGDPADRRVFRALRAHADIILVAAGTARTEDYGPAKLSDAHIARRRRDGREDLPRIAVVTRSADLDPGARIFTAPGPRPLVIAPADAPADRLDRARTVADVVVVGHGGVDLGAALVALGRLGAADVLAEGGPTLNASLAAAGLIDELCLTLSPRLVGGDAKRVLHGDAVPGAPPLALHAVLEDEGMLFLRYRG